MRALAILMLGFDVREILMSWFSVWSLNFCHQRCAPVNGAVLSFCMDCVQVSGRLMLCSL